MKKLVLLFTFGSLLLVACQNQSSSSQNTPPPAGMTSEPVPGAMLDYVYQGEPQKIDEEGFWKNGKKNGIWVTYHNDAKHLPKVVAHYVDGQLEGPYMEVNNRAQVEVLASYRNNKLHGRYPYYKFNRMTEQHFYQNGLLDGQMTTYHQNTDKIQKLIEFKEGKEHGKYQFFNEEGRLTMEYIYENGEKKSGGIIK